MATPTPRSAAPRLAAAGVERHLTELYARRGVEGRVELAVRAERDGWLDTP